jgi:exosortase F-associated protein
VAYLGLQICKNEAFRLKYFMLKRLVIGTICVAGLLLVFVFQNFNVATRLNIGSSEITNFIYNKTIRFLLNDLFAMGLIYALFPLRKYVLFAFVVQLAGMLLFMMPYIIIKLHYPRYNGPLLNFLHRLILNPTLLLLLIPAFFYQEGSSSKIS